MIQTSRASGEEIRKILEQMEPVLNGLPVEHVYMAVLALAFIIQEPEIHPAKLATGVNDCSQWIAAYLETTNAAGIVDAAQAN